MSKKAKTFRLSFEAIEKLDLLQGIYQELQTSDFKSLKISQANVLEKIIHDHYINLIPQLEKNFVQSVKQKMNMKERS